MIDPDSGHFAICFAISKKSMRTFQTLFARRYKNRVDQLQCVCRNGNTVLLEMCIHGAQAEMMENYLNQLHVDLNYKNTLTGCTALFEACSRGYRHLVEILIRRGVDVRIQGKLLNGELCTPAEIARRRGYDAIYQLFNVVQQMPVPRAPPQSPPQVRIERFNPRAQQIQRAQQQQRQRSQSPIEMLRPALPPPPSSVVVPQAPSKPIEVSHITIDGERIELETKHQNTSPIIKLVISNTKKYITKKTTPRVHLSVITGMTFDANEVKIHTTNDGKISIKYEDGTEIFNQTDYEKELARINRPKYKDELPGWGVCVVCTEPLFEPCINNCGSIYCRECLEKMYKHNVKMDPIHRDKEMDGITCIPVDAIRMAMQLFLQ
jgi:hypothetical protein